MSKKLSQNQIIIGKLDEINGKLDKLLAPGVSPFPPHVEPDYSIYVDDPSKSYAEIVKEYSDGAKGFAENIRQNMAQAGTFKPAADFMADYPSFFAE